MPEQVNIASLTIDVDDVIKESARLKTELDKVRKSKKDLDTTTKQGQIDDAKAAVAIKNLSKAYRDNQSFAASLESANKNLAKTMATQNKSTQQLRDSRSQLNQISKNIVGDTEEEVALRSKLNTAIDAQTKKIREQGSEFNASKDQIGEYKNNIIEAYNALKQQETVLKGVQKELESNLETVDKTSEEYEQWSTALVVVNKDLAKVTDSLDEQKGVVDISNLSLGNFIEQSGKAGGASAFIGQASKGAIAGLWGMVKASLAFIATPIGIVLAVIAGAFLLIKNAMNRSEESTTKLKKAFSAFSGILSGLLKVLEPLGDFLIDGLVKGFELLEKGVFAALNAIATGLEFLGLDDAAKSMRNFTNEIEESVKASKDLVAAELDLAKAQRIARKTQLDFQKDAEKLRQIRDDESRTTAEKQKANEDLGKVLKKQSEEELAIANKAVNVAKLRIKLDGERKDTLDELAAAETEIADIQERIAGQESEQIVNRISLQKEATEKAIVNQNAELEIFIKSQGVKAKTLKEDLELEKQVSEEKKKILDEELKAKFISQSEYDSAILDLNNNLLEKQAELSVENAKIELDRYIQNNKSKLDSDKFLSEQLFEEEKIRLDNTAEQKKEFAKKELDEGIISRTEFNEAINEVDEENRIANEDLEKERKEARLEQEAIDFENKLAIQEERNASEFELMSAQLEQDRIAEVREAAKTGADVTAINKKFAAAQVNIDKIKSKAQLDAAQDTFGGVAQLLGESTAAGKAAGIAQATINTYQGVTEVWKAPAVLPEPFNTASKVVATGVTLGSGLAAVSKISSTKLERGGILKGARHSQGGIDLGNNEEAEGGEAMINRKSTSMFAPLLSAINVAGGGKKFASGGIRGGSSVPSNLIDIDALALRLAEANSALPAPQVSIEEIREVGNNLDVIESDSTL